MFKISKDGEEGIGMETNRDISKLDNSIVFHLHLSSWVILVQLFFSSFLPIKILKDVCWIHRGSGRFSMTIPSSLVAPCDAPSSASNVIEMLEAAIFFSPSMKP